MLLGERLSQLRKEAQIKAEELAAGVGVKVRMVYLYEKNSAKPSFDVLVKIADYFGVSTDYLIGRSDDPRSEEFSQNRRTFMETKETALLETLPASLLPAYNEAREKNKKNPEKLQQIIDTFTKMAKDYHSLTK